MIRNKFRLLGAALLGAIACTFAVPGVAHAATCTKIDVALDECFATTTTAVQTNVWNTAADTDWHQTLTATSQTTWNVVAKMNGTAVVSYPNSMYLYQVNLANAGYTYSSWHSGLPVTSTGDGYESAYDMWLDGAPGTGQEVMVWTDTYNETPAGSDTGLTWTDPYFGNKYEIWTNSTHSTISFVAKTNSHTGTVSLGSMLVFVVRYYDTSDPVVADHTLYQIGYGFEIRTTQDVSKEFSLAGLSITIQ